MVFLKTIIHLLYNSSSRLPGYFTLFLNQCPFHTIIDLPINTYTRNEICSILGTTTANMAGKSLYHSSLLQARGGKIRYLRRGLGMPSWKAREKSAYYIRTSHQCCPIDHLRRADQGNIEHLRIGDAQLHTECPIKCLPGPYLLPHDTADGMGYGLDDTNSPSTLNT